MPDNETVLGSWPRLVRTEDLIVWAGQLTDRLRYVAAPWMVVGDTVKLRNPNWIVEFPPGTTVTSGGAATGDLTGNYPNPTVAKASGDFLLPNAGTALVVGSMTAKSRVLGHPTSNGVLELDANMDIDSAGTRTQDSASLPSWMARLNTTTDNFEIWRSPAGSVVLSNLFKLDLNAAVYLAGPNPMIRTQMMPGTYTCQLGVWASGSKPVGDVMVNSGQPVAAPTWLLRMDTLGDNVSFMRQAPSLGAWTTPFALSATGTMTLLGDAQYGQGRCSAIRYSAGGGSLSGGWSNAIGFGWNGTNISARVDNVSPGYYLTVTSASDKRLKQGIEDNCPGLATVLALRPVTFEYEAEKGFPAGRQYGLIAQEAREHVPAAVVEFEGEERYLGIEYAKLVPILIQAIKELATRRI